MTKSSGFLKITSLGGMICIVSVFAIVMPSQVKAEESESHCHYERTQTLPIHFDGFHPTIEGSANGKPITMLVDSGSYATFLYEHAADRLNLGLRHSFQMVNGMGGASETYVFHAKEFSIGSSQGKQVDIPVIHKYSRDTTADGLGGADFLFQSADLEVSLTDRYLKFYKSQGCEYTFLAYWDDNASIVPLLAGRKGNPRPFIGVGVNRRKMLSAMIDSGAPHSMIDLRAAADLGITPESPNVIKARFSASGIGEHKTDVWIAHFDTISIGNETIRDANIAITDMWAGEQKDSRKMYVERDIRSGQQMILGADFLRSHRVLFSLMQKRMYFSYLGGNVFDTGDKDNFSWYKTAAMRGDTDAQYHLGRLYLYSPDIPRDAPQAATLFSKLAEQGDHRAQIELGILYESGDGVTKDITQAIAWYRKSAEGGNRYGQLNLARMYEYGNGMEKDQAQALDWYRKAAEQGDSDAALKVGVHYLQGKGVPKDDAVAHAWLAKATKDEKPAQYNQLGHALFNLGMYTESAAAFRKAVEKAPAAEFSGLWLYIAQARAEKTEDMAKELESNMSKWKERKWPAAIANFYLGRTAPDEFMKLAHDADKKIDNEQTCAANLHTAEWHLISHRKKEAQPLLAAAVRDCPKRYVEYSSAVAELELLDGK